MATCDDCGRERTPEDGEYSPIQLIMGQKPGWYSSSDEGVELCPEDMEKLFKKANGR